jgi:hypothetical protein
MKNENFKKSHKRAIAKVIRIIFLLYFIVGIPLAFIGIKIRCEKEGYGYCRITVPSLLFKSLVWPKTVHDGLTTTPNTTIPGWKMYRDADHQYLFEYPGDFFFRVNPKRGHGQAIYSPDTTVSADGEVSGGIYITSSLPHPSDILPIYTDDMVEDHSLATLIKLPEEATARAYIRELTKTVLVLITSKGRKITLWCNNDVGRCQTLLKQVLPTFQIDK